MMEGLSIANFKAFGEEPQELPLKPLTIVFGANSSGKSSLLHSVLYAHHAAQNGELDVVYPSLGEGLVDLGGFRQLIHGASKGAENRLSLRFRCRAEDLAATLDERRNRVNRMLNGPDSTVWRSFLDGLDSVDLSIRIGLARDEKGHPVQGAKPAVEEYELKVGGVDAFSAFTTGKGQVRFSEVNVDLPLFCSIFESLIDWKSFQHEESVDIQTIADEAMIQLLDRLELVTNGFLPREVDDIDGEPKELSIKALNEKPDPVRVIQDYFPQFLSELVWGVGEMIRSDLSSIQYLAPLRSYPPRHIGFAEGDAFNNKAGGGKAWLQVAEDEEVRKKVNEWLSNPDKLRTPYSIKIRNFYSNSKVEAWAKILVQDAARGAAGALFSDVITEDDRYIMLKEENLNANLSAAEIGLLDFSEEEYLQMSEEKRKQVLIGLSKEQKKLYSLLEDFYADEDISESIVSNDISKLVADGPKSIVLTDNRTDTEVSHRDVGIGISQVLPVLTMAFGSKQQILAIEQPEIHLHPGLQAELADVFIESAMGENQNRCLLETHSEHLILRILRRIREQSKKTNPSIKASDVAVLYVMPEKDGSKIVQIRISDDGEFMDPWPGGFFPERMQEMFGI